MHLGIIEIEVLIFLILELLYTPQNYVEDFKSFNLYRFYLPIFVMLEVKIDKNFTYTH